MPAYGTVLIDIDLGLGRQYGYRHPARREVTQDSSVLVSTRNAAECHPARSHMAHGLCDVCYQRERAHCAGVRR
jgi:hypothetical protein